MRSRDVEGRVRAGRRRVRVNILTRLVIFTLVFFLVILIYYRWFPTTLSELLADIFGLQFVKFFREYKIPVALVIYVVVVVVVSVRESTKYVRNLDIISTSLTEITEFDKAVPAFPRELSELEIALKDVKYTLAQNEKERAEAEKQKNEILTFLAHDLRTPLTSVVGYLSLLRDNPELPAEQRAKYVDITVDKAYRLEELLDEFFDVTRMSTKSMVLSRQELNITTLLYQIADEFYPVFTDKGLGLELAIAPNIRLFADPDKIARVFDNLLKNAANYAPYGTSVLLEAEQREGYAVIRVRNESPEIPPERLEQLFDMYYRADSARSARTGGAGLGLAIAREIVILHGGNILASWADGWITFTIRLPEEGTLQQAENDEEEAEGREQPEQPAETGAPEEREEREPAEEPEPPAEAEQPEPQKQE